MEGVEILTKGLAGTSFRSGGGGGGGGSYGGAGERGGGGCVCVLESHYKSHNTEPQPHKQARLVPQAT